MTRKRRVLITLLAAVFMLGSAATVDAEPIAGKAWDQKAATSLSQELVEAAGDLRQSVRRQPDIQSPGIRRARRQALDNLRVAENSIRSLARQLEAGAGPLDTYPTFRRIQLLRGDVARNTQRAALREPTTSKLEAARSILEQLEPYFSAEAKAYAELDEG
jgi:hypothetical protein